MAREGGQVDGMTAVKLAHQNIVEISETGEKVKQNEIDAIVGGPHGPSQWRGYSFIINFESSQLIRINLAMSLKLNHPQNLIPNEWEKNWL